MLKNCDERFKHGIALTLALLEDRLGRVRRGRAPGRARLFEAEIGQRRADVDHDGALERVIGVARVEF